MAKGQKTGGRTKGTPNKATAALKDMILQALDGVGGVEYLKTQAAQSPTAFLSLIGRILPMQHTGEDGGPVEIISRWATSAAEAVIDPSAASKP